jgi:hypothetical protein
MEYYLAIKRNDMIHAKIWLNIDNITFSQESSSKDHIQYDFINIISTVENLQRQK